MQLSLPTHQCIPITCTHCTRKGFIHFKEREREREKEETYRYSSTIWLSMRCFTAGRGFPLISPLNPLMKVASFAVLFVLKPLVGGRFLLSFHFMCCAFAIVGFNINLLS
ncbi:hypothetical protein HOY80DRAFT_382396 [Tuber brumale]|nr:hypothetical protein HOY80DRAFT_382396 [Tuber brumale]